MGDREHDGIWFEVNGERYVFPLNGECSLDGMLPGIRIDAAGVFRVWPSGSIATGTVKSARTRRRFVKLLMGGGIGRNEAERIAGEYVRRCGSYREGFVCYVLDLIS